MNSVHKELRKLANYSSSEFPAITRILYTKEDLEARDYFISLCEEIGLKIKIDPIEIFFNILNPFFKITSNTRTSNKCPTRQYEPFRSYQTNMYKQDLS